jgi:hypoxanthine phosphoribosyltransferase
MADHLPGGVTAQLLNRDEVRACVERMADAIAPRINDDTVAVCLLSGGIWFAADLTRALAERGRLVAFDALWLGSYGDERSSRGKVDVHAPMQRPVEGRQVLILDDVFDSGLSLHEAVRIVREKGAAEVLTAVFARKPWPHPRGTQPDFVGWEAPARYLVGYGLDSGGRMRGLPGICARD